MRVTRLRIENVHPFENAEFDFGNARVVILLGPNGSGKTTTLRLIAHGLVDLKDNSYLSRRLEANKGRVEIEIEIGDKRLLVRRSPKLEAFLKGEKEKRFGVEAYKRLLPTEKPDTAVSLMFYSVIDDKIRSGGYDVTEFVKHVLGIKSFFDALEKLKKYVNNIKREVSGKKKSKEGELRSLDKTIGTKEAELSRLKSRKPELEKRLEELTKLSEALEGRVRELRESKAALEAEVSRLREELRDYEVLKAALGELDEGTRKILREVGERLVFLKRFLDYGGFGKLRELEKLSKSAAELGLPADISALARLDFSAELEAAREESSRLAAELAELGAEIRRDEGELKELRDEIEELRSKLKGLLRKFELVGCRDPEAVESCVRERLEEARKALEDLRTKLNEIIAKKKLAFNAKEALERGLELGEPRCPVCGSELSEERIRELIEKYERELEDLERKQRELEGNIESAEELVKRLEEFDRETKDYARMREELARKSEELLGISRSVEERKKRYGELYKRLEEAKRRYGELRLKHELVQKAKENLETRRILTDALARIPEELARNAEILSGLLANDEAELLELSKRFAEIEKLERKLLELREKEAELSRIGAELSKLEEELKRVRGDRERLLRELESVRTSIQRLEAELEEARKRLESLNEEIKRLKDKEKLLEKLSRNLLMQSKSSLSTKFNEFIMDFLFRRVNAELKEIVKKINNHEHEGIKRASIRVEPSKKHIVLKARRLDEFGREREIRELSAGEGLLVAVSFILAFRKALSEKLAILPLMLDEPTANADENTREEVIKLVTDFLYDGVIPQVFIATHDEKLVDKLSMRLVEKNLSYAIFRLEREGGKTRVVPLEGPTPQRRGFSLFSRPSRSRALGAPNRPS